MINYNAAQLHNMAQMIDIEDAIRKDEKGDADIAAVKLVGELVFDHAQGRWYRWGGHYWQVDKIDEVRARVAAAIHSEYEAEADRQRRNNGNGNNGNGNIGNLKNKYALALADECTQRAKGIHKQVRVKNVLEWLASDRKFALIGDEWDTNRQLLGCQNGVIDLQTGDLADGRPEEFIKSACPVEYRGVNYPAGLWEKTVAEIFNNDQEVIDFIQRLFGYCITGNVDEHIFCVFAGAGRNGKSLLIDVIAETLGFDLTTSAPADAIMDMGKSADGPQPFLFGLRGKRLAYLSESNEGRRFDGSLIKLLSGGDKLNVRTLHSEPVLFAPTHKVILLTNDKPHANSSDQALWDRMILIEFTQRFVDNPDVNKGEKQQDKTLKGRLLADKSAVLSWLVRGCLQWQKQGLNIPSAIRAAAAEYRQQEDTLQGFFDEKCEFGPAFTVQAGALYQDYKNWAFDNGHSPMSSTAFGKKVALKVGKSILQRNGTQVSKIYKGIRLIP